MGIPDDDIDYVFTVPTTGGENAKLIVREAAVNVRKFEQLFFYLAGSCGIKINIQVIELQVTAVGKTKSSGWDNQKISKSETGKFRTGKASICIWNGLSTLLRQLAGDALKINDKHGET